jgi:HEPN domain-containing protein
MPPEKKDPTSPLEWLRRARSNFARSKADRNIPEVLLEDLCFDAQQAAEKAAKAVLVHRGTAFPRTHDIAALLTIVQNSGIEVPGEIREAAALTEYAVQARYPGPAEEVTLGEYKRAVELAEAVLKWATDLIQP